ncbi:MAG: hypothetical protein ACTMIX_11080, partial [Kluyvera intermedia]
MNHLTLASIVLTFFRRSLLLCREVGKMQPFPSKQPDYKIMSVRLVLAKGREKSLLRRHPWVFSGAV